MEKIDKMASKVEFKSGKKTDWKKSNVRIHGSFKCMQISLFQHRTSLKIKQIVKCSSIFESIVQSQSPMVKIIFSTECKSRLSEEMAGNLFVLYCSDKTDK
jgi:hypothetical protein